MKTANVMDLSAGMSSYAVNADNRNLTKKTEDAASLFGSLMNQFGSANLWSQVDASGKQNTFSGIDHCNPSDSGNTSYGVGNSNISMASESTVADKVDAAKEQIDQFEDDVVRTVSDQLGVSEEQVEQALEDMGISVFDLLNPGNLGQLVMNLTGMEESAQLLVNADFQSLMDQIGQLGSDLMKELNLEMTQMNELIQQMDVLETPLVLDEETVASEMMQVGTSDNTVIMGENELNTAVVDLSGSAEQGPAGEEGQIVAEELPESESVMLTERSVSAVQSEETSTVEENQPSLGSSIVSGQKNAEDVEQNRMGLDGNEADGQEEVQTVSDAGSKEQTAAGHEDGEREFSANAQGARRPQNTPMNNNQDIAGMNMDVSAGDTVLEAPQNETSYVDFHTLEFINQVADNVRAAVQNQVTSLEMQLNPEHLGKILVSLTSREGAVNAQFAAANEAVRAALEAQISTLRENLNQAGVKVDAIEVTVETHEFEQNLEQNARGGQEQAAQQERRNSRRSISLDSLDELSGMMSEEERLVAQIMQDNGNSMDVTV